MTSHVVSPGSHSVPGLSPGSTTVSGIGGSRKDKAERRPQTMAPSTRVADLFSAVRKGSVRDLDAALGALKKPGGSSGTGSGSAQAASDRSHSSQGVSSSSGNAGATHCGSGGASGGLLAGGSGAGGSAALAALAGQSGLSSSAGVDARNGLGVTALHVAVWRNHLGCLQRLLDAGADPDARDSESGWTSLHRAFHFGHWAAAGLLLAAGASVTVTDTRGRTPLDLILAFSSHGEQIPGEIGAAASLRAAGSGHGEIDAASNAQQLSRSGQNSAEVFAWGNGANYQLGTGAAGIQRVPCRVDSLQDCKVVHLAAARFHSAAITQAGELYTWGFGRGGRLGHPDFDVHSGQVAVILPRRVTGLGGKRVKVVAAAKHHTVAATVSGELFTWGSNREGRLGYGVPDTQPTPRKVTSLRASVVAVAASNKHSAAVTESGDVFTWGCNADGQLGYGTSNSASNSTPRIVENLKGRPMVAVSAAKHHTLALSADGEVWTWGHRMVMPRKVKIERDTRKGLGISPLNFHRQEKLHCVSVAAGFLLSSAVSADGLLFCWASHDPALKCHQLKSLGGQQAACVSAGKYRTAVVTRQGSVFVWDSVDPRTMHSGPVGPTLGSSNGLGQAGSIAGSSRGGSGAAVGGQGFGMAASRSRENLVAEDSGAAGGASAGSSSALANQGGGGGRGVHPGLDPWAFLPLPQPVQVPGVRHATAIAVGELHSVAISAVHEPAFTFSPLVLNASAAADADALGPHVPRSLLAEALECRDAKEGTEGDAETGVDATLPLEGHDSSLQGVGSDERSVSQQPLSSEAQGVLPLKQMCERVVAHSVVELRNAVQVLEVAESLQVPHLVAFCQELVLANLDIIVLSVPQQLAQCRSTVLAQLELLAHPQPKDEHEATLGNEAWRRASPCLQRNRARVHQWLGRRLPTPSARHPPVVESEAPDWDSWQGEGLAGGAPHQEGEKHNVQRWAMQRSSSSDDVHAMPSVRAGSVSPASPWLSNSSPWEGGRSDPVFGGTRALLEGGGELEQEERALVGKQVRALKKKLQQISALEQRRAEGYRLDAQQLAKLKSKSEVEAALVVLEGGGSLEEAAAAGEYAAKMAELVGLGVPSIAEDCERHEKVRGRKKEKKQKGKERRKEGHTQASGDGHRKSDSVKADEQAKASSPSADGRHPSGKEKADIEIENSTSKDLGPELRGKTDSWPMGAEQQEDGARRVANQSSTPAPASSAKPAGSTSKKKGRKGALSLFLSGALDPDASDEARPASPTAPQVVTPVAHAAPSTPSGTAWGKSALRTGGSAPSLKEIQTEQTRVQSRAPPPAPSPPGPSSKAAFSKPAVQGSAAPLPAPAGTDGRPRAAVGGGPVSGIRIALAGGSAASGKGASGPSVPSGVGPTHVAPGKGALGAVGASTTSGAGPETGEGAGQGTLKLSLYELLQLNQQQVQQRSSEPVAVRPKQHPQNSQAKSVESYGSSFEDDRSQGASVRASAWRKPAKGPQEGDGSSIGTTSVSLRDIQMQQEKHGRERRAMLAPAASTSPLPHSAAGSGHGGPPGSAASPPVQSRWYRGADEDTPKASSLRCILKEEQAMKDLKARFGATSVRIVLPQSGASPDFRH